MVMALHSSDLQGFGVKVRIPLSEGPFPYPDLWSFFLLLIGKTVSPFLLFLSGIPMMYVLVYLITPKDTEVTFILYCSFLAKLSGSSQMTRL